MSNPPVIGAITDDFGRTHYPQNITIERPPTPLPGRIKDDQDLARWKTEHAEAVHQVSVLERDRRSMLARATVDEIRRHDDSLATARVRVERAGSVIEDAERGFAEAARRVKAAQPERKAKHKAALEARDEAERVIREVYGPAAEMIAEALRKVAACQAVISAAGEPPEGEAYAPDSEAFRHPPHCSFERLRDGVRLPPVVRSEPAIWPARG